MALTPEAATPNRNPGIAPARDIRPQTGVYYDAAGSPQVAYMAATVNAAGQAAPAVGSSAPASFAAVTPNDATILPAGVQGLWVGGTGNLAVRGINDAAPVTLLAVPAGTFIRGQFARVYSTNTTATNIVAVA